MRLDRRDVSFEGACGKVLASELDERRKAEKPKRCADGGRLIVRRAFDHLDYASPMQVIWNTFVKESHNRDTVSRLAKLG